MLNQSPETTLLDQLPGSGSFLDDVILGLREFPKTLPCKYFYDRRGSQLFDQICDLEEYYPTRTELAIMEAFAPEMASQIGPGVMLIEYGSGSSVKTRILLDHLHAVAGYVPVDISRKHLQHTANGLARLYPELEVLPVCADFTTEFDLPILKCEPSHCAVYFPGSTIGNFVPQEAQRLLARIAPLCGTSGGLLIGIDLQKDRGTLEAAYDDSKGITAEFNLNLLHRINRELDADFLPFQFRHHSIYNEKHGRVEMHLVSEQTQVVSIREHSFEFSRGETICTEYSHKYTIDQFEAIAANGGLTLRRHWTDPQQKFAVLHFAVVD